jgi:hypothetical protein
MSSSQWTKRSREAEKMAEQAWEHLVSALESVSDTTRDRVGSAAHEARGRTRAAVDALAGRRRGRTWGWVVGLTAAGFVTGWVSAMAARRAIAALGDVPAPALSDAEDQPVGLRA